MRRALTDEYLEKLAKAFIYHTYGEPEPSETPKPQLSFERYVEAWRNGKDFTADLRTIQQSTSRSEVTRQTVVFPSQPKPPVRTTKVPAGEENLLHPAANMASHS